MRKSIIITVFVLLIGAIGAGTALANNPPGDPLPVNGEPDCFGARVSHSASEHGLTPAAKVGATEGTLEFLETPGVDPVWEEAYVNYWTENGVSVRTVQMWIRTNCSDEPIIGNP